MLARKARPVGSGIAAPAAAAEEFVAPHPWRATHDNFRITPISGTTANFDSAGRCMRSVLELDHERRERETREWGSQEGGDGPKDTQRQRKPPADAFWRVFGPPHLVAAHWTGASKETENDAHSAT